MKNLLYKQLENLTTAEKKKITVIIESLFQPRTETDTVSCPHCKSKKTRKNGNQLGIQRYKCSECSKNYRLNTGTNCRNLKKPELLKAYIPYMMKGYSLNKCAELTGVSVQTAFVWKHKILDVMENRYKKAV